MVRDCYKVYYVDLVTDHYITYNTLVGEDVLAEESHGEDFFADVRKEAMVRIDGSELPLFLKRFSKERLVKKLEAQGYYTARYRLADDEYPAYIEIKVTQLKTSGRHAIIGASLKAMA